MKQSQPGAPLVRFGRGGEGGGINCMCVACDFGFGGEDFFSPIVLFSLWYIIRLFTDGVAAPPLHLMALF